MNTKTIPVPLRATMYIYEPGIDDLEWQDNVVLCDDCAANLRLFRVDTADSDARCAACGCTGDEPFCRGGRA
jgi:hypothetical protein